MKLLATVLLMAATTPALAGSYSDLVALHAEFRRFETPPSLDGAPDYTAATTARRHAELPRFQARLAAIDPTSWPVSQRVDWQIVRAELNGFDFNVRVLKPWERDPAFYQQMWTAQSDTPAHEGPVNHGAIELWQYTFPLSKDADAKLAKALRTVPPFLAQAKRNLTGNARDLWLAGTANIRQQDADLAELEKKVPNASRELRDAIAKARAASVELAAWLDAEAPKKNGPSGIGKDNYTWMLQNVHLVPLTWDQEKAILERELARAWSQLAIEEQRNRALPPMQPISSKSEYDLRASAAVTHYIEFLTKSGTMTVRPYYDARMREHLLDYVPPEKRDFFATVNHHEPLALFLHWYHWWDHGLMELEPHASPIRKEPLLYNVWDSRSEGMATAAEEIMLNAGLFDGQPRARELVYVMLAARAARGLASLHAQANEFTMKQASDFHVEWTPRGWMKRDNLLGFEQQLYLRQPGYGTSYVTGKVLIDELMQARIKQLGKDFTTRRFFDEFNASGLIPVSLIRLEMTGSGCCEFAPAR
jgi:uncharacterized protein (DUF885 family)